MSVAAAAGEVWQCAYCEYRNLRASEVCEVCEAAATDPFHRVLPLPPPEVFAPVKELSDLARRVRKHVAVENSSKLGACLAKADEVLACLVDRRYNAPLWRGIPLDFLESLLTSLAPNYS